MSYHPYKDTTIKPKGEIDMKVKDLIAKLQEQNQDAEIITITIGNNNVWEYTSEPEIKKSENSYGKKVWIQ